MKSSNRDYLGSVDHIRAFAALLVVVYHGLQLFTYKFRGGTDGNVWLYSTNPVTAFLFEGHTAVTLFMVLSGFIFTVGALNKQVSFRGFMTNRLLRIYPLFVLMTFIAIAAMPSKFTFSGFAQLMLGMGNMPGSLELMPVSGMFWAVAVEMQFYLLFPLLNRLLSRSGPVSFGKLIAAIAVVRALIWLVSNGPSVYFLLYTNIAGRIDHFLLGMIAAWLYLKRPQMFRGWWKVALVAIAAVAMLWAFNQIHGFASAEPWRLLWLDLEGGVWALAILIYVSTCRATNFISRGVAKLGELSYSIYLLHFIILTIMIEHGWFIQLSQLTSTANAMLNVVALFVPAVLALSTITYNGVELPFLRMRVKYLSPLPAEEKAAPPPRSKEEDTRELAKVS